MATMKIKKDDMVQVIAGKDKGKEGKVLSVDAKNNKVLVEGVNIVHKHSKPSMQNQQGGIIEKALKKFKRKFEKTGVVKELRARQQFDKPSVLNRLKRERAIYVQKLQQVEE